MRYTVCCYALLLSLLLPDFACAEAQQLFDQANSEYVKKNYSVAIHDYEQLVHNYGASPALFYNLALAYAKADHPGKAILNLERAHTLAPGDKEIAALLTEFRKKEGLFVSPPKGLEKAAALLETDQWSWLGLASLLLFTSLFLLSSFARGKRARWLIAIQNGSLLAAILFFSVVIYLWDDANPAIITAENGRLLISPIAEADLVVSLREGQKVFPIRSHDRYLYVRDHNNKKGWISSSSLEAVNNPEKWAAQEMP